MEPAPFFLLTPLESLKVAKPKAGRIAEHTAKLTC